MHKNDFKDLHAVMEKLLQKYNLSDDINKQNIFNNWESLVGRKISIQCKPVEIKNGELLIKARNTIWKHELGQRQADLLNLLNGRIKSSPVKKIRII